MSLPSHPRRGREAVRARTPNRRSAPTQTRASRAPLPTQIPQSESRDGPAKTLPDCAVAMPPTHPLHASHPRHMYIPPDSSGTYLSALISLPVLVYLLPPPMNPYTVAYGRPLQNPHPHYCRPHIGRELMLRSTRLLLLLSLMLSHTAALKQYIDFSRDERGKLTRNMRARPRKGSAPWGRPLLPPSRRCPRFPSTRGREAPAGWISYAPGRPALQGGGGDVGFANN